MAELDLRRTGGRPAGAALGLALLALASPAWGDSIVIDPTGFPRDRPGAFVYRLDEPQTGSGTLTVQWTDVHDRLVERRAIPVDLAGVAEIAFTLDLRRAVAMRNEVRARLDLGRRTRDAVATFVARPMDDPWRDYQVIMWQGRNARQYAALKSVGVSAGMVIAERANPGAELARPQVDAMLRNDLRWYVENIATDFYAAYHRWFPDRPVNWLYLDAKARYRANSGDLSALVREPSLSDPQWLARIADRLGVVVRAHRPYAPLYYSLGDEAGIADLAANWDFDFAPVSLAAMREWLRARYGDLGALNRQWGTRHTSWDVVMPETTTEAMARGDENYSAWSDFKEWMDEAFARAVRHGRDAVRAADPSALAAIEGTQVPGWGGYDYARLAPETDVMDIYDKGGNGALAGAFHPGLVVLSTTVGGGAKEGHRLWRLWLQGRRGAIIWDEDNGYATAEGEVGPVGREKGQQFREMRSGLGALFINAARQFDRIAIVYGQESFRARWMLDHRAKGAAWIERDAEAEYEQAHPLRDAFEGFLRLARQTDVQPGILSTDQVERGALRGAGIRLLILPHHLALSDAAAEEIRGFAAREGVVVADIVPGEFDGRVRRRPTPALQDLFAGAQGRAMLFTPQPADAAGERFRAILKQTDARRPASPSVEILDAQGQPAMGVETYRFRNGQATLLGIIREEAADDPAARRIARLVLPAEAHATDLRAGRSLGKLKSLDIAVPAAEPVLLALTPAAPAPPRLVAPDRLAAGQTATIAVEVDRQAELAVLRFEAIDPTGRVVPHYSGNWLVSGGRGERLLPFAFNDTPGAWQVRVTDVLSGHPAIAPMVLAGP